MSERLQNYGYRARIGYTSPPATTEVFPYEFYMTVPKGVTLVLTTVGIVDMTPAEIDQAYLLSVQAAKAMKRAGIDLLVLGGVPINLSRGFDNVDSLIRETEEAIGLPVTTSITAQIGALRRMGAKNVAVGHPFTPQHDGMFYEYLEHYGFASTGMGRIGGGAIDLGKIPGSTTLDLGRQLLRDNPQADTLWLPCPHWAAAEAIEPLEQEFGVTVITANQAICWDALRRVGIDDRLEGRGRLLRDA